MDFIAATIHTILHASFIDRGTSPLLYSLQESARWLIICAAIFIPLARFFPGKRTQPQVHRDMLTDAVYWFSGPIVYAPIGAILTVALVSVLYKGDASKEIFVHGLPPIRDLPIWVQVFMMLLATDILQYWAHRLFHIDGLWKYHAVHHSSKHVDWMSSARFHPLNIILYSTLMNALVFLLGFSPAAFGTLFLFNVIYSPLVHANLSWTYGPFRYVLASPVFHRWHHTHYKEGGNKNFAPTFPFIDLIFGTFYMPKDKIPENFGAHNDTVPDDFFGQIAYPFKKKHD